LPNEREKYSLEKLYINQRKLQTKRLLKW
jgi:ribosomal silencing factor RsfS